MDCARVGDFAARGANPAGWRLARLAYLARRGTGGTRTGAEASGLGQGSMPAIALVAPTAADARVPSSKGRAASWGPLRRHAADLRALERRITSRDRAIATTYSATSRAPARSAARCGVMRRDGRLAVPGPRTC